MKLQVPLMLKNERIIMDNLNNFFEDKTVVIIAHRLSTVKNADQIIVLGTGEIMEKRYPYRID